MDSGLIDEFVADWIFSGKSSVTAETYRRCLIRLCLRFDEIDLTNVKSWLHDTHSVSMRRKQAQAVRAFGKWSERYGDGIWPWWSLIPLPSEPVTPQPTASIDDYLSAMAQLKTLRDRAVVSILWGCGLRRSEVANLKRGDLNLAEGLAVIRQTKTGRPRVVPVPPPTVRLLRRLLQSHACDSVFGMSTNAIRLMLERYQLKSSHAWRRGWAVESLRNGVSEASVRAAAGWRSGEMVSRYTNALAEELAAVEFSRTWRN